MSSNISINSGIQQVAANSGSSEKQSGKSGRPDDRFSDHLADAAVDKKSSRVPNEGGEGVVDNELPGEDNLPVDILTQEVEVAGIEVPEIGVLEVEPQEISVDELAISVKNGDVEQVDVKPVATEVEPSVDIIEAPENADDAVVPVAIATAEVGKDVNAAKSQSEGAALKAVGAANAKNVSGRRENLKVDQGEVENKGLPAGEADDGPETTRAARSMDRVGGVGREDHTDRMERPLIRTEGRGRANGVIESKVEGGRAMTPEQAMNNNGAMKTERAANAASNAFGVRGVESRLASMMEASGTFDGDMKITAGKQENHMLPAMPQQLSVTGMSRTVVSQVLELRRSGELETMGLDVKTDVNKPVKVIEVQLMPRNLGTVGITIRNVAGRINISIEVQGAEAERLIKTEIDKIAGAIRQAGQVVEDITIKRGVQMSQQTDSLTDDRGRQGEANFGQNSENPMWQSSRDEIDEGSNRQKFGEIGIEERGKIAASSSKDARQGIYL